jgi:hypothetical protein
LRACFAGMAFILSNRLEKLCAIFSSNPQVVKQA